MRVIVGEWEAALLFRNGRCAGELGPGAHRFWNPFETVDVKRMPRRFWVQAASIDVISADRFPLRVSLSALLRIDQPREAFEGQFDVAAPIVFRTMTAETAASFSLEELMEKRAELAGKVRERAGEAVPGCQVDAVLVTGVVLPPEIRRLFSDVERAKREGQAALERARAEHASLRSLANAARLLKGNPELMNLRLLQSLGGAKGASLVLGSTAFSPLSPAPEAAPRADE